LLLLSGSPQVPLWGELRSCQVPLLLVAGQLDGKFAGIKRRMMARLRQGLSSSSAASDAAVLSSSSNGASSQEQQQQVMIRHQWAEVPGAGHAVHVEAPLQLLRLITSFTETL
jgi:pimeloyl-ACP methyl ester carboxylesterase